MLDDNKVLMITETPLILSNDQAIAAHSGRKTQHRIISESQGNGSSCPMGRKGDRIWVREAYAPPLPNDYELRYTDQLLIKGEAWLSAETMPRWACRTVLEITETRLDRLHSVCRDEVFAEGLRTGDDWLTNYQNTWQAVWTSNPLMWVITFNRLLCVS